MPLLPLAGNPTAALTRGLFPSIGWLVMVEQSIKYLGDLRCEVTHGPSGSVLITDAPVDNQGQGASFSPTDLAAASLGVCMLTIMGIAARARGIDLGETHVRVQKIMTQQPPRKIAEIRVCFEVPLAADHPQRRALEAAACNCPVHLSLHRGVVQSIEFLWGEERSGI